MKHFIFASLFTAFAFALTGCGLAHCDLRTNPECADIKIPDVSAIPTTPTAAKS